MKAITTILFCFWAFLLQAQITGTVTDEAGLPLPFASIYIDGTTTGTSSNLDGFYEFNTTEKSFILVFQYVGFQIQKEKITIGKEPLVLNVQLKEEEVALDEIVVKANAEDPAYPIIRKAMERRKYYRDLIQQYTCDSYVKGVQKVVKVPEKVMGQDVGDLDGMIDTTGQGIIYLSESESKISYKVGEGKKEEMISSKVSGDDNGFSFNRATLMDFNFYDNSIEIERQIVSPIANNAFLFYKYQFEGSYFNENGLEINKIKLIPKSSENPTFSGYIYIVEDLWNIYSTDCFISGDAINQPILDTIRIRQVHVPMDGKDKWVLLSQNMDFRLGIFGFEFEGSFTGIFRNYSFDNENEIAFQKNEIFKVNEGANTKDTNYWKKIRPIPLTVEESIDYVRKDSLAILRSSKNYLDSIDQENNRFELIDLLAGYSFNRSFQKSSFSIASPLNTIQFDAVRGMSGQLNITYKKSFDQNEYRYLEVTPNLSYGIAEQRLRPALDATFKFNSTNNARLNIGGGLMIKQFDHSEPISPTINTLYSVYAKRNLIRYYDATHGYLTYEQEVVNGIFTDIELEYERRQPLVLNSSYSFFNKDRTYDSNDPQDPNQFLPAFEKHDAFSIDVLLRFVPAQKFLTYPNRKVILGSNFPVFSVGYKKGIPFGDAVIDYDFLSIGMEGDYKIGIIGTFSFMTEVGQFLQKDSVQFMDYKHFQGNETIFGKSESYLSSFLAMPYYEYSTTAPYWQTHLYHNFDGFVADRIPLIKKLDISFIAGAKFLQIENQKSYSELSVGIDNIGFKAIRILRLDFVSSFNDWQREKYAIVLGLKMNLGG